MLLQRFHDYMRLNGDVFFALALIGSLYNRAWFLGFLLLYLGLVIACSLGGSIIQSCRRYPGIFGTYRGLYYNVKIAAVAILLVLSLYHGDNLGVLETPLKTLLIAYILVLNVDRFRWEVLLAGASLAAVVSLGIALYQTQILMVPRPGGATNPIRFGMITLVFALISTVGLLHSRGDRRIVALSLAGMACGVAATVMSGSRGAVVVLPLVAVILSPILWRRSRRAFAIAAALVLLFVGGMLAGNVGSMVTRLDSGVMSLLTGGAHGADNSVADRVRLVELAIKLFNTNQLAGVGEDAWNDATLMLSQQADDFIQLPYNQAHNQYFDDLAKGGLVRFACGFLLLFLPLHLFNKRKPFSMQPGSEFALAGVIVSVSFLVYCLSESLLILSLPASIQTGLTLYLLAACDAQRQREAISSPRAAAPPSPGQPTPAG